MEKRLTVIPPHDPDKMTDADVATLDLVKLRDQMVKGIYVLESTLFQQSKYEYERVGKTRNLLNRIEDRLFEQEMLDRLDPDQQIKLYEVLNRNMSHSLNFLQGLHENVTSGIDTLNKIEKLKTESDTIKKVEDEGSSAALDDVKKLIMQKIKDRVSKS